MSFKTLQVECFKISMSSLTLNILVNVMFVITLKKSSNMFSNMLFDFS
jgi:hypothetical protein